jgi:glutamate 5-kinase
MPSKFQAARIVTDCGESMIVADGRAPDVLPRLLAGEELGTLFVPSARKRTGRSRWIGSARPAGVIVIDDGAARALVERNKSLLPAGVTKVDGDFAKGDVVDIRDGRGIAIARGLSN